MNEPQKIRNPNLLCEPQEFRNPSLISEPQSIRNPCTLCEPSRSRNPIELSALSHHVKETHAHYASHRKLSTQNGRASQDNRETREIDASHFERETHRKEASHGILETQCRCASQQGEETHTPQASHSDTETHGRKAQNDDGGEDGEMKEGMRRMKKRVARLKHPRLRLLVEDYYDIQKLRIAAGHRLLMYSKLGLLTPEQKEKLGEIVEDLKKEERVLLGIIQLELRDVKISSWLLRIKGIGPAMAAGVIAWIDDISRAPHVSSLWRYAGLHVVDGKAPKRKRGEKAPWNWRLKTHMWKVVKQLLMAKNGFYTAWYEKFKREEIRKAEEAGKKIVPATELPRVKGKKIETPELISQGHVDNRAKRKLAKLFLSHLWVEWKKREGLPVTPPYSEKLGHSTTGPPYGEEKEGGPEA